MKHYSASLVGGANSVDEGASIITVGNSRAAQGVAATQDSIVIYNVEGPSGLTNKATSAAGLVIVPSADDIGSTHVIGADGREIAISDFAGGGSAATFNPTVDFVPVHGHTGTGASEWENSLISQTGGGTRTVTRTIAGSVTSHFGNYLDVNFATADAADLTLFRMQFPLNTSTQGTFEVDGVTYHGPVLRTADNIAEFQANFPARIGVGNAFTLNIQAT